MNLFGSTDDMKKKNCGLIIAGTNEKKMSEKKKRAESQKRLKWATARFLSLSHDTTSCIMTQVHMGMHGQA